MTIEGERLDPIAADVDAAMAALEQRRAVERAFAGDHTLWQEDPTEVADRLGWLHSPAELAGQAGALDQFARRAAADGFTHAVLMGMGGSSLFPEVMARTFGRRDGYLELAVLDTTDPAAIRRLADRLPLANTLFVAASKSGTTLETLSHLAFFWDEVGKPEQFVVITDPGSPLAATAAERGFRATFQNRPDIGGRYSALSHFGMVPAALLGVDITDLLQRAVSMLAAPELGLRLGAIMGAAARAGRDKLTVVLPDEVASFGPWLEQLIAESTGKHGTGIVPVDGEPLGPPGAYGDDRLFVALGDHQHRALDALAGAGHPVVVLPYRQRSDIGAEVVRWELATAFAGAVLGINPFDQPNVAEAKAATSRVLAAPGGLPTIEPEPVEGLLGHLRPGDYLAIQAYVDPGSPVVARLQSARVALRDRYRVATTLGIGPRFLHSTGQLHKGGPATGVFPQIVAGDAGDVAIPGQPFGFSTLKQAQAAGDLETLRGHGLRAARVTADDVVRVATGG
jgi:transaldolase / glucose-6-phosphate isomerase